MDDHSGEGRSPYGDRMRWDALFADLEIQLGSAEAEDRRAEVAELTRAERSAVLLADRLVAGVGERVRLSLRSGTDLTATLVDAGPSWALLASAGREHLVPLAGVVAVAGLPDGAAVPPSSGLRRLGLGHALRAVARDRTLVRVVTLGPVLLGRLDAVGADHVDVALAFADSGRPTGERYAVGFGGLDLVTGL
ncbi:MAG: hypothetical protein JWP95_1308 [Actinotalea sp.]|nr:hypothetical protein [Actinotalea sp.]